MNQIRTINAFALFLTAGVVSCTPSPHDPTAATPQPTFVQVPMTDPTTPLAPNPTAPALPQHWVQVTELRSLMKKLSAKTQQDWPKQTLQDPEDKQSTDNTLAMQNAATLADGLAATAVHISESIADAKMSPADRAGFIAEANTLRDQSLQLARDARSMRVEQMQHSLDAVGTTCVSCHTRYRDISGQLNIKQIESDPTPNSTH